MCSHGLFTELCALGILSEHTLAGVEQTVLKHTVCWIWFVHSTLAICKSSASILLLSRLWGEICTAAKQWLPWAWIFVFKREILIRHSSYIANLYCKAYSHVWALFHFRSEDSRNIYFYSFYFGVYKVCNEVPCQHDSSKTETARRKEVYEYCHDPALIMELNIDQNKPTDSSFTAWYLYFCMYGFPLTGMIAWVTVNILSATVWLLSRGFRQWLEFLMLSSTKLGGLLLLTFNWISSVG